MAVDTNVLSQYGTQVDVSDGVVRFGGTTMITPQVYVERRHNSTFKSIPSTQEMQAIQGGKGVLKLAVDLGRQQHADGDEWIHREIVGARGDGRSGDGQVAGAEGEGEAKSQDAGWSVRPRTTRAAGDEVEGEDAGSQDWSSGWKQFGNSGRRGRDGHLGELTCWLARGC